MPRSVLSVRGFSDVSFTAGTRTSLVLSTMATVQQLGEYVSERIRQLVQSRDHFLGGGVFRSSSSRNATFAPDLLHHLPALDGKHYTDLAFEMGEAIGASNVDLEGPGSGFFAFSSRRAQCDVFHGTADRKGSSGYSDCLRNQSFGFSSHGHGSSDDVTVVGTTALRFRLVNL